MAGWGRSRLVVTDGENGRLGAARFRSRAAIAALRVQCASVAAVIRPPFFPAAPLVRTEVRRYRGPHLRWHCRDGVEDRSLHPLA
jgi:hypothetical protein